MLCGANDDWLSRDLPSAAIGANTLDVFFDGIHLWLLQNSALVGGFDTWLCGQSQQTSLGLLYSQDSDPDSCWLQVRSPLEFAQYGTPVGTESGFVYAFGVQLNRWTVYRLSPTSTQLHNVSFNVNDFNTFSCYVVW